MRAAKQHDPDDDLDEELEDEEMDDFEEEAEDDELEADEDVPGLVDPLYFPDDDDEDDDL